ncbi:uncharacterized protein LOC120359207 [Solenopsis invicta]|uniref:uncharacterized protein LOC120359207 n=1 Tax=Solenopsis invicta TaxID=13686 RepID=UPI00193CDF94|nr:uncharacterized protein LOC120359207 [Solenopsis invicta]
MVKACCVPDCKSGVNVPSHKFSKNIERCSQWVESLKLHELKNYCLQDLHKYRVCHEHFSEKDYSCSLYKRTLLKTAIPIIKNPINIIDNNLQHVQSQHKQLQENENIEQHNQAPQLSAIPIIENCIDTIDNNLQNVQSQQENENVTEQHNQTPQLAHPENACSSRITHIEKKNETV